MFVATINGAVVAGVSLEGVRPRVSKSFKEGAEYLRVVFGALFSIPLGVLADLYALDLSILWFAVILTLVALLTKFVGCGLSAPTPLGRQEDGFLPPAHSLWYTSAEAMRRAPSTNSSALNA